MRKRPKSIWYAFIACILALKSKIDLVYNFIIDYQKNQVVFRKFHVVFSFYSNKRSACL